ncbi:DUF397 domain-containing protein [Streptomyces sp. IF17]|nr:DUF397 domain-containing protein [Streptomyces alkaliphilus]
MAPRFVFRTSTYSGGQPDSQCVEVATNVPGAVAVRDSKRRTPARLHLSPAAWCAFLDVEEGRREPQALPSTPNSTLAERTFPNPLQGGSLSSAQTTFPHE